ncbi:putative LRR containing protein, partial [Trachipleistophora hominis]
VIKPSIIVVQYKNLKVLRVEAEFLHNMRSLSVLMPCLEVLEIQYSPSVKDNSRISVEKIRIRELLIRCDGFDRVHRHKIISKKNEMIGFMNELKFYIAFESLECIAFTYSKTSILFDPKTLQIIK